MQTSEQLLSQSVEILGRLEIWLRTLLLETMKGNDAMAMTAQQIVTILNSAHAKNDVALAELVARLRSIQEQLSAALQNSDLSAVEVAAAQLAQDADELEAAAHDGSAGTTV